MSLRFNILFPVLDLSRDEWQMNLINKISTTLHLMSRNSNAQFERDLILLLGSLRRTMPYSFHLTKELEDLAHKALEILTKRGWKIDLSKPDRNAD